jgi:diguanylate cyclase (GGDEF)-like protein
VSDAARAPAAALPHTSFLDRLNASQEARRSDGETLALLFVDLGVVDDSDALWGYAFGDAVRARFSLQLRSEVLRERDFLGEIGRDGLACVLETVPSAGVALLAAEKLLRVLDEPVLAGEHELWARPAIGVALFPGDGEDAAALLSNARAACLAARSRAERITVYAQAEQAPGDDRFLRENLLRAAVARNALQIVFEPQLECRSGRVVGVQALLQSGSDQGIVSIDAALAAANTGELIERVLNGALRNCGEFRQSAGLDLRVAVHLPLRALREADLAERVARALKTWNLRAGRLTIAVGGAGGLADDAESRTALRGLDKLGLRLSADADGLSPAALAEFAALPFEELRLDATRLLGAEPGAEPAAAKQQVVKALIELAHGLRREVVALGVAD